MKIALLLRLAVSLLCFTTSTSSIAQTPAKPAMSGYWNAETNLSTRDYTIVRFYNGQDQLVYEERLDNLCLDLAKGNGRCRRTSRKLAATLQLVLREPSVCASGTLLAQQFNSTRRLQRAYAIR
ncbi:hypothetical protein [Hymenobacter volaticus]|uniref:Uncharacterized protein n=1 Tax=Hymenobacter volaticus TaxID=2932254 RepID=A0ABY4GCU1_9BACT|nr:hypothetical protein [Hymenobacter volaticus]UOQ68740.1 hypothetical protein MUN86_23805 [Hymenobacter volaticus]